MRSPSSLSLPGIEWNIVSGEVDRTDISPRSPGSTTDGEREVHPGARRSFSTDIIQNPQKLDDKIAYGSFTLTGGHGETEQGDQLCVEILLHVIRIEDG